jgi:hypothetical protein
LNYIEMYHSNLYVQEVKSGCTSTDVEVYMQGHRGSDPHNPGVLCTQTATDRLVSFGTLLCVCASTWWCTYIWYVCLQASYVQEMVQRHGQDYHWRSQPIDP